MNPGSPKTHDRDRIHGMVMAGNYGWAIMALMELVELKENHADMDSSIADILARPSRTKRALCNIDKPTTEA